MGTGIIVGIILAILLIGLLVPVLRPNPTLIEDVELRGGVNVSSEGITEAHEECDIILTFHHKRLQM